MKEIRPPSPSIWYNANGYEWGYLGPGGEQLDQQGNPIEQQGSGRMGVVLAVLFLLAIVTLILVGAWWSGSFDQQTPHSIPTTYGPLCGGK